VSECELEGARQVVESFLHVYCIGIFLKLIEEHVDDRYGGEFENTGRGFS
jgi:hypothetical protein